MEIFRPSVRESFRTALIVLLALAVPASAFADAKYKRKSDVKVKVKQTSRTQVQLKKKGQDKKAEDLKPEIDLTADLFFKIQGEIQNIRDEQIQEYMALIRETPNNDPEKPDLLFRLAELFAQKQRYWHFKYMETLTKADQVKKSQRSRYMRAAKKYQNEEKKWLIEAIKVYKALAENKHFKNYSRIDEGLFYYAYTLQQAKYHDEARKVYFRLIKDYPNSKYIPYAYFAFGQHYFEQSQFDNAHKFYDKVLEFPKSDLYNLAMYYKGWVYYNQAAFKDSLETWFNVARKTQGSKKESTLNRAAKKDLVKAYAEVGKPDKAYQFFQRVDKDYAFTMLGFLGELYLSQGQAPETVYIYRQMINLEPKDKRICEWQYTVVRATLTMKSNEDKVKELERLVRLYQYLKDQKALPEAAMAECRMNAQETAGELAKIWHVEGKKTLNYDTLADAARLYKVYLEVFPDAEDAPEMQFYYGELLWMRAEAEKNPSKAAVLWEDAALAYNAVIESGTADKEVLKESALAHVLAWKNALDVDPAADPKLDADKVEENLKPQEIGEKEQKMLAAFDKYIQYITDPNDEELIQIKFFKGKIYWRHKHFDRAIPLFEEIIAKHKTHEYAEFAARLLIDSYILTGKYEAVSSTVDKLINDKKFLEDKEDLQADLALLKRQTMRKLAERYEKDKQYKECGDAYVEIARKYDTGKTDDMAEVYFNAAVCYEKAKLIGQAIFWREQLTQKYADARKKTKTYDMVEQAKYALGVNYSQIAFYDKAAEKFEDYARKFGGEKNAADALNDAVFYRKGLGHDSKAIDDTLFFVKQYGRKKPKEAAMAFFSLVDIYDKKGNDRQVIKHLQDYLRQWGRKGGVDREIVANAMIGQRLWEASCPRKDKYGACVTITRERVIKTKSKRRRKGQKRTQCGPESKNKIVVHDRKRPLVKDAQKYFRKALKLWNKGAAVKKVGGADETEKKWRVREMAYWAAAANFYLAEEEYESFLALKFPTGLSFDPRKAKKMKESKKKFDKWLADKRKLLDSARKDYKNVVDEFGIGAQDWAIAAAARVGQLFQNFSDNLFTAEIPPLPEDLRVLARQSGIPISDMEDDFQATYCDTLTDAATPLENESITAFSFCLEESTKRNWFNRWSRLCEQELGQIRPQDFPTASEIRAEPTLVPEILDRQSIETAIDAG